MRYSLSHEHRAVLRWLVEKQRSGEITQPFLYSVVREGVVIPGAGEYLPYPQTVGAFDALEHIDLLIRTRVGPSFRCTVTQSAYDAVDADFTETQEDINWGRLQTFLAECFKWEELRMLANQLGVDHESIGETSKPSFARELVTYMKHRGRLWELVQTAFTMK